MAFQCFARGLSRSSVDDLNRFAIQGTLPSLTILLDLDTETSLQRRAGRSERDRIEREKIAFHEAVRQGYLTQACEAAADWLVLNARQTPDELLAETLAELKERGWL